MKANELRIGNWFIEKDEVKQFDGDFYHLLGCEPIPLNTNWLEKFGFEKNNNNQFILMEGDVDILFNKDLNGWTCDGINFSINMTDYVHQLQNLYFALTGEELTINC